MRLPYKNIKITEKGISARGPPPDETSNSQQGLRLRLFSLPSPGRASAYGILAMEPGGAQLTSLPASLEQARVERLPARAYYIADFISEDEEKVLLDKV